MTETIWFLVVGGVLIFMGLASSTFKELPISSAMVYLAIGFGLAPFGAGLLKIDETGPVKVTISRSQRRSCSWEGMEGTCDASTRG